MKNICYFPITKFDINLINKIIGMLWLFFVRFKIKAVCITRPEAGILQSLRNFYEIISRRVIHKISIFLNITIF